MIGRVLDFLGTRGLAVAVAVAVVALAAVTVGYELKVRSMRSQLEYFEGELLKEKQAAAMLRAQLLLMEANRDALRGEVDDQNRAIQELRRQGIRAEGAASLRAVRTLQEGQARRREIENSKKPGAEEMNRWLREVLTP